MDWSNLQAIYDELGTMKEVAKLFECSVHKVQRELKKQGIESHPLGSPKGYKWDEKRHTAHRQAMQRPEVKARYRENLLKRLPSMSGPSANSPLEKLLHGALMRAGISFSTQERKLNKYCVDIEIKQAPVIIEADGARHFLHSEADALRDESLSDAGYDVVRFNGTAINADPDGCISQVIKLFDLKSDTDPTYEIRNGMTGSNNPCWRGGKQVFSCEQCETTFEQYPSNRSQKRKFCSAKCYWLWMRKHPEQSNVHARWNKHRASKIVTQSELHGDMQSQAEMPWPLNNRAE